MLRQKNSIRLYQFELLLAYVFQFGSVAYGSLPATTLITLLAAVPILKLAKCVSQIKEQDTTSISTLDAQTAKSQMMFSLLMIVGLCAGYWLG